MPIRLFLLLIFTLPAVCSPLIKGYKSSIYSISKNNNQLCEYSKRQQQRWCLNTAKNPLGLYVGFSQILVYSDSAVEAIDIVRQEIKWSIPLKSVYKLHINYPVIVMFYTDRSFRAFDYFSGIQLWK